MAKTLILTLIGPCDGDKNVSIVLQNIWKFVLYNSRLQRTKHYPHQKLFGTCLGQSINSADISTYPLSSTTPLLLVFTLYLSIVYKVKQTA